MQLLSIHLWIQLDRQAIKSTDKEVPFLWTPECEKAFQKLKQSLATAPVLTHYRPELPTQLETDASDNVVAAILSQLSPEDGLWHPVAYISRSMTPSEQNYKIHDKELLAIVVALNEWRARAELEGLRKATNTELLPGQQAEEPPPITVNGQDEWEVEEIIASQLSYRKLQNLSNSYPQQRN